MTRIQSRLLPAALAGLGFAIGTATGAPQDRGPESANVPREEEVARRDGLYTAIERVYPALVRIYVVMEQPREGRMVRVPGAGSGAIISPDGYVVTNHHVAGNASHIVCNLSDQQKVEATLVGTDPLADIAVLKIDREQLHDPDAPLPIAEWGDSSRVRVGDTVFAMGSPAAISQSVTRGIIANTKMIMPGRGGMEKLDGEDVGTIVRWFVHDATIFGGNSGGPLVNDRGEIIGINEIGFAGLSGAIPGNLARRVANEIIKYGEVSRSWTGMSLQARLDAQADRRGALVASVAPKSPAAQAGVRAGDLLQEYGGQRIDCAIAEDVPIAHEYLMDVPIGSAVDVVLERDGGAVSTRLTTVRRERTLPPAAGLRPWGIVYSDISRSMMIEEDLADRSGIFVRSVRPGGPASEANPPLRSGDVIVAIDGVAVDAAEDLARLAREHAEAGEERRSLLLELSRDDARLLTVIELGPERKQRPAGRAKKAWLPIETQVLTSDLARATGHEGTRGVRVTRVIETSTSGQGGTTLVVGDIITAVQDRPVNASRASDTRVFRNLIERRAIGDDVRLDIIRDGEARTLEVTLLEPPLGPEAMDRYENELLEIECRGLTTVERAQAPTAEGGVHVEKVASGGWAALGDVRPDDVILEIGGVPVRNVDDLEDLLTQAADGHHAQIVLFVRRGAETRYLVLEPKWDAP